MSVPQFELSYRVSADFGPKELIRVLNLAVENVGFDEDTQFDLVLHRKDDERQSLEITLGELGQHIHAQAWPALHQIILSNQWIKGMNLKVQLVLRPDHGTLSVRGELEDAQRRAQLVKKLEPFLAEQTKLNGQAPTQVETERERLFGSMLMTEAVIQASREAFLAGDAKQALASAWQLLEKQQAGLLKIHGQNPENILGVLSQQPPRIIFPDASGQELLEVLAGLGHLWAGIAFLAKPILRSRQPHPDEASRVLKLLVAIGAILERLENATPNPIRKAGRPAPGRRTTGQPGIKKTKAKAGVKKSPKKNALRKKAVNKK